MRSWNLSLSVASLFAILILCSVFPGCTSIQNILTPPVTPAPTEEPTPEVTAIITSVPVIQTIPTEPIRTQASDMELLLALDASQARVLDLLDGINTELAKAALN